MVLCAVAIVSCTKVITGEPQRPVLPEIAPDYRTEMAPIFEVQTGIEEGPNLNERAQLGRVLFHDRMLSQNGAVSCNSCHHQSHGFAEPRALSSGLRQELTERNASHLANPGAQFAYFWDGRANDLTTQVTMPVENHVEMGFRSLDDLVVRLEQLDYYPDLFEAAYVRPNPPSSASKTPCPPSSVAWCRAVPRPTTPSPKPCPTCGIRGACCKATSPSPG